MTVTQDRQSAANIDAVADQLGSAFNLSSRQLRQLASMLTRGEVTIKRRAVRLQPFVGPNTAAMAEIQRFAMHGNQAAKAELRSIVNYHLASRFEPLATFLSQLPYEWRRVLLNATQETVVGIELLGTGNIVTGVRVAHSSTLFEYGLREAFTLKFVQFLQIAEWMRGNEERLPTITLSMPPLRDRNDSATQGTRWAALLTFFDNFPEAMRDLLMKKAMQSLTGVQFQTHPTGIVIMVCTFAQ